MQGNCLLLFFLRFTCTVCSLIFSCKRQTSETSENNLLSSVPYPPAYPLSALSFPLLVC